MNPTGPQVLEELQKILTSPKFGRAGRLALFLRFVVENAIEGKEDSLKESVLGIEVFGRDTSYDPRIDPVVRVEARRLRQRLEEYYREEGAADPIVIELPKGGYVPAFRLSEIPILDEAPPAAIPVPTLAQSGRRKQILLAFAGSLALLLLALGGYWLYNRTGGQGTPVQNSLLILPFSNLSSDEQNEYFSQGLTEELIDAVTRLEGVRVVAPSWDSGVDREQQVRELVERQGIGWILQGSARKSGDRLRITARLVDADAGTHVWTHSYERELRDIFSIQEEIAQAIANSLEVQLHMGWGEKPVRRQRTNLVAYNHYLNGRYQLKKFSRDGLLKSVEHFQAAIGEDPEYAPAFAGLSSAYTSLGYFRIITSPDAFQKAQEAADRALSIDGRLGEAFACSGTLAALKEWNWKKAEEQLRRALELNPSSPDIHLAYAGSVLMPTGRIEDAQKELQMALELDPVSVHAFLILGNNLLIARRYEEAVEQFRKAIALNDQFPNTWEDMGIAYAYAGKKKEAESAFLRAAALWGRQPARIGPFENAMLGRLNEAREQVRSLEQLAGREYVRPAFMAWVYSLTGDRDRAFHWLDKAYAEKESELAWIKTAPRYESLRSDPRYRELLKRVGLGE